MHTLSASFVLAYHGCGQAIAERLLGNESFVFSRNDYDWLGSGVYFWEANPDRALAWAQETALRRASQRRSYTPAVVGAVIDLGFCLDLISGNGIAAVENAYMRLVQDMSAIPAPIPVNSGGDDLRRRNLDCAVINYLHTFRSRDPELTSFDTVRGVFAEGEQLYPNAGFRRKTHIQICVRRPSLIKGVFRVPQEHFS